MPDWFIMLLPKLTTALFVFAVGACIGSLINVLVYRLPLGLDVVRPTSRCPSCGTKLTWRENIPIFGWIMLRGRCRFCRCKISPEYPIVEFFTAAVFCLFYVLWYMVNPGDTWLGIPWGSAAPEWALNSPAYTWPIFVVLLTLIGCLIAMTIVDAKTFTIPLVLAWVPAIVAVVVLPAHAAWFEYRLGPLTELSPGQWGGESGRRVWQSATEWLWAIPTPNPSQLGMIGVALGGTAGLGLSMLLLRFGLIRRSFADYEEWEKAELARLEPERDQQAAEEAVQGPAQPHESELWIQYPHARREMLKEVAFLGGPAGGAWLGAWAAGQWFTGEAPLWLTVLSGVLLGYLIGGAVVWGVRILGSLAFGKEAMGLGDVHLMAAVGACIGWIDPVIAFFLAAFLGTGWEFARRILGGTLNKALPYGPHLAAATVLVVLCKPLVEMGLSRMLGMPIDLP
ncbi:MAG: leader peptidase (prepilin peptidase)/N-methyltransferase [Phycisphaerales bacterium]|jgi:leader peptidase (prepilin peptidase)/N-methyltransferase